MDDFSIAATPSTLEKIKEKHNVSVLEVEEAFYNMEGVALIDNRKKNKTHPPTVWFVSCTEGGRILKVVGIPLKEKKEFLIKTAFDPEDWEIDLYEENKY